MQNSNPIKDDLQVGQNLKRIDDLESFKDEYEGTKFHQKIAIAIKESKTIDEEIKKIAWQSIKDKIIWLVIGAVILLVGIFLKDFVSELAKQTANTFVK